MCRCGHRWLVQIARFEGLNQASRAKEHRELGAESCWSCSNFTRGTTLLDSGPGVGRNRCGKEPEIIDDWGGSRCGGKCSLHEHKAPRRRRAQGEWRLAPPCTTAATAATPAATPRHRFLLGGLYSPPFLLLLLLLCPPYLSRLPSSSSSRHRPPPPPIMHRSRRRHPPAAASLPLQGNTFPAGQQPMALSWA